MKEALGHSSAQRSLGRSLTTGRTGYVPSEAPGTMGYYTPRDSIQQSTEALGLAQSSLRNPVRACPLHVPSTRVYSSLIVCGQATEQAVVH